MIYTSKEKEMFQKVKLEFTNAYKELLDKMYRVYVERGKQRDIGSPLHHRQGPATLLAYAGTKVRRVETMLSFNGWETDIEMLEGLMEEAVDGANYLLYLASLCALLLDEKKEVR